MKWRGILKVLFAPPGTPEYEIGYVIGRALREKVVGKRGTHMGPAPEKESPEESFRKLAEQNKDLFGGGEGPGKG